MFNRYREHGLPLIPVEPGDKRPLAQLTGWQRFCEKGPTEAECDAWERMGIERYGMPLGPAGGIMAVDIDSDDINVLNAVPASPVRKRGRKGETRFFRYHPGVHSRGMIAGCVDVLALGRQTVMPPTVHPETNRPYVWLTPDTLPEFSVSDLPEFTPADFDAMVRALGDPAAELAAGAPVELKGPFTGDGDPKHPWPHGSHDRLKYICNGIIARGASPDEAVRELLRYDEENHRPIGYFFCHGMTSDQAADPATNALSFYSNNLKTFNRRQMRQGLPPAVPLISGGEILRVEVMAEMAEAPKATPWPEPKGLLSQIQFLIDEASPRRQPGLSLGGAIAIGSAVIANRVKIGTTWPNVYVLNVAQTGAGKSFPYTIAQTLLSPENGLDLIGCGGYRSSSAMIKDLLGRRERLDLVDECSSLFRTIRDGGVFQADMLDILNQLWSNSSAMFIGPDSVGRERVAVWHPCVSVLLSTTPRGLRGSVSRDFLTQGLVPRCLIFHDPDYGQIKDSSMSEDNLRGVANALVQLRQEILKGAGQEPVNLVNPRPRPVNLTITPEASKRLKDYSFQCAERISDEELDEVERHFLSRAGQQASKIALIHGALRCMRVEEEDITWAIEVLNACRLNSQALIQPIAAENSQELSVLRMLDVIRSHGSIEHAQLLAKTRFMKSFERNAILADLEAEGRVKTQIIATATKSRKIWSII